MMTAFPTTTHLLYRWGAFLKTKRQLIIIASIVLTVSFIGAAVIKRLGVSSLLSGYSCPSEACVRLSRQSAQPDVLTIRSGSFVKFSNSEGERHNITLDHSSVQHLDPERYESGDFSGKEAWNVQFKKDGAFTFGDKYNKNIHINIIVYTPGKKYKIN